MNGTKMTSASNDAAPKPFFPKEVIAFVANKAKIPYEDVLGPLRKRVHVRARAVIIQVLAARGISLSAIGRLMNRDHSSICNLYHKFDQYYADDELAQALLNTAKREFLSPKVPKRETAPPPPPKPTEIKNIVVKQDKRSYDFASIGVGEVRAYRIDDPRDAERVRKAAHNRNAISNVYLRTKTVGEYLHVIRVR